MRDYTTKHKIGYVAVPCELDKRGKVKDWSVDFTFFDTIEECEEYIADWGSRWILYPNAKIYKAPVADALQLAHKRAVRTY